MCQVCCQLCKQRDGGGGVDHTTVFMQDQLKKDTHTHKDTQLWKHWLSSDKGKVEGWKTETFHCLLNILKYVNSKG